MTNFRTGPERIICMTEESVEFLHAIGRSDLIAGVSVYAKRPAAVSQHPVISSFTHANLKKIQKIKPDLIIGFSDIQKDIARDLIAEGMDVYISNQRSISKGLVEIHEGHLKYQRNGNMTEFIVCLPSYD